MSFEDIWFMVPMSHQAKAAPVSVEYTAIYTPHPLNLIAAPQSGTIPTLQMETSQVEGLVQEHTAGQRGS